MVVNVLCHNFFGHITNGTHKNYPSEVDSKDWSEEELDKLISHLNSQKTEIENDNAKLSCTSDAASIDINNRKINSYNNQINKYQRIETDLFRFKYAFCDAKCSRLESNCKQYCEKIWY